MTDTTKDTSHVVTVTISGPTGCGKSAIYGELEIALLAMGIPVTHANPAEAMSEKRLTHSDWAGALEMYKPSVVLVEANKGDLDMAMQNVKDIAHCLSDIRRFVEAKFMTVGDLPSPEGLLLSGPEWKHESDAIIAAINRVSNFYEQEQQKIIDKKIRDEWASGENRCNDCKSNDFTLCPHNGKEAV